MGTKYDPEKWHAIAYDEDGFVFNEHVDGYLAVKLTDEDDEYDGSDGELSEISIVRGSAVPVPQSFYPGEEFHRGSGSYRSTDVLFTVDTNYGSYEFSEIPLVWARAKATADALNAAGVH